MNRIGSASLLVNNEVNGLHFESSNANELKLKLDHWQALGEDEKQRYRKNARQSYELYYTPEKNFHQLMSIYSSVVDERKND